MTLYQKSNDWEKCIICGDCFTKEIDYKDHLNDCLDYQNVFEFLDDLRESGIVNMFGARSFIVEEFSCTPELAKKALVRWMDTFSARHPKETSIN